jgi:hypothetical protein
VICAELALKIKCGHVTDIGGEAYEFAVRHGYWKPSHSGGEGFGEELGVGCGESSRAVAWLK